MLKTLTGVVTAAFLLGACETRPPMIAASAPQPQHQTRTFTLFVDYDRATLSPEALAVVREAADAAKSGKNTRVTCTGHTDTTGSPNYNMELSLHRASKVKDALMREGLPAASIAVVGRGEEAPLVATGNDVRNPQNRRVEIVLQQ